MSTAAQPAVQKRADLEIIPQQYGLEAWWVVRDPLTLRFVRLREPEYALFEMLDGRHDVADLVEEYEARFAPRRILPEEVSRFIAMLVQAGLVWVREPGQGELLRLRGEASRNLQRRARWTNPLAIRFRGIDPTRLFDLIYPSVRGLFSRTAVVATCCLAVAAILLVAVRWDEFVARLPTFHAFFTPENMLLLVAVLAGVKVLHEFGHGLACKRFGGECRELGLMFLVFTPCLYCNVTDAWRFPSRWRRAAVGAAGIYIEVLLASIATFVWWSSEPGLLNQISLGVMLVGSVSTVVFNGNPLLKYDGYYVLSDLADAPNLAQRSSAVVRNALGRFFLRRHDDDPLLPTQNRGWYAAYAVASAVYRWVIAFSIILLLVYLARPYRLEIFARALGVLTLVSLVGLPLVRLAKRFREPGSGKSLRRFRVAAAVVVAAGLAGAAAVVPVPHRVFGPFEVEPYRPQRVFAEVGGALDVAPVRYGRSVARGETIARLTNPDLELQIEALAVRRNRLEVRLASLRREQFERPSAAATIGQNEESLASTEKQLAEKLRDRDRLNVTALRDGVLYPPPLAPDAAAASEELGGWTGRPLDAENHGAAVEVGTYLGQIGEPDRYEAVIVIGQDDVEAIQVGDPVDLLLDAMPERRFRGTVDEIAAAELSESPRRLSSRAGGEVAVRAEAESKERPLFTSYSVRVKIDDPEGLFRIGWRGTARIHSDPKPLGRRFYQWASRTFHFSL
jgi:putative peptide zinc metalloprotease protein